MCVCIFADLLFIFPDISSPSPFASKGQHLTQHTTRGIFRSIIIYWHLRFLEFSGFLSNGPSLTTGFRSPGRCHTGSRERRRPCGRRPKVRNRLRGSVLCAKRERVRIRVDTNFLESCSVSIFLVFLTLKTL